MSVHYYGGAEVEVTLCGERFSVTDLTIGRKDLSEVEAFSPKKYEATFETTISGEGYQALVDALTPPQRGPTDVTLARRVVYGGRKGRSAWRRLLAKGYVAIGEWPGVAPFPIPAGMVAKP